ncbi:UbiX family flavin prenyltransferase [Streptomyces sp. NPDC050423]|uniref:UbiX family flavin prenyltransferase n=1 Tax=Streptomyces sp. NPDC050423 TaxID=3155402 RepID=UPI0034308ED3
MPYALGAVSRIAQGQSSSHVERASDVCLKKRRPLVRCVRETPFNLIHLRNMTQVTEAGAVVYPMIPTYGIRTGYADGLIGRAAGIALKERRRLVLVPRETPLSEIHLENLLALSRMGAVTLSPMPAFYTIPPSTGDLVEHTGTRILDQFALPAPHARRWKGPAAARADLNALSATGGLTGRAASPARTVPLPAPHDPGGAAFHR